MQLTKTIILKLDVLDNDLAELLKAFSQGMNYASQIAFDIGKPAGSAQIQKATYKHLRNNLNLKSQMACNVARPGFWSLQNTSESDRQEMLFFAGGEIKNHRNIRSKERRRLQKAGGRYLGTRSSMRLLRNLAGRETRFMTSVNHEVSKDLIEFAVDNGVSVIGMEDLTGIRKKTENRVSNEFR